MRVSVCRTTKSLSPSRKSIRCIATGVMNTSVLIAMDTSVTT